MKRIVAVMFALMLASCGGGGGGSAVGNGGGSSGSSDVQITFSTNTLNFSYIEGQNPASQNMTASLSGSTSQEIYLGAVITGNAISIPIQVVVNPTTATAGITITPAAGLAAGTYVGTIQMEACTTQACTQEYSGTPYIVNYTVTVTAALKASVSSINLTAPQGGAAVSQSMTLSVPPGAATVNARIVYPGSQTGWLSVAQNGTNVTVQASPGGLSPDYYAANLVLSLSDNSQSLTIPVSLTVGDGLLVPAGPTITVTSSTTPQQLQGSELIGLAAGVNATSWSATSDQSWLVLDEGSGSFNSTLGWHIDPVAFSLLSNNATYRA
ncbi:MAG TPA: hypothetical protein VK832_15560, partial [Burkholderiaceae bacterium]|nr:hypothetical protein [Burkholderiaceae bacterium]